MDTVLNWLWQGMVVALALEGLLGALRRVRASSRCVICWTALLLVVLLPAVSAVAAGAAAGALPFMPDQAFVSLPEDSWPSADVIATVWMIWIGVSAVLFARAMLLLRRARAGASPFPERTAARLRHWTRIRGGGRRPALVTSEAVATAAVIGGGAPMIAVAPNLLTRLDDEEMDRVLVHEWAHVQRRDDLLCLVQLLVRAIAGWHPAVWWIDRRLHLEREAACDEMVVALSGSPKSYAMCLVKLAAVRADGPPLLAAPAIRTAGRGLRTRVTRIVSRRAPFSHAGSRTVATLVACALCAVSVAAGGLTVVDLRELPLPLPVIRIAPVVTTAPSATASLVTFSETAGEAQASLPSLASAQTAPAQGRPSGASEKPGEETDTMPATRATVPVAVDDGRAVPVTADRADPSGAEPVTNIDVPATTLSASEVESAALWTRAADFGVGVGHRSRAAGVATAGAFRRFAKRIAGSY